MFRLARKPSLWAGFFFRLAFVLVAALTVIVASYFVAKRGTFFMLTLVTLIAIGALWELIRFWLRLRRGAPVVEIEQQPLAYGDSAELRVIEQHPRLLTEMGVKLIGECYTSASTDISSYRETKIARTRCYEEELMRTKPDSVAPLSRVLLLQLPKSPPADGMSWMIVVDARLKRGDVVEHTYPLRVRETA